MKDKGRRDYTLNPTSRGPTNRVQFNAHAPIADLFGSGIGFRLMFIESGILIEALQALFAKGITALPLHDSVLVAASEAGAAEEVMKEAFARVTGESGGKLKVDFGSLLQ